MTYVDGFVLVIPKKGIPAYRKIASDAGKVWRDHGALEYRECVAEDLLAKGQMRKKLKVKPSETVVFAWIVYRSRAHRDRVNRKVMKDPRITGVDMTNMPVDPKRMMFGGFTTIVEY